MQKLIAILCLSLIFSCGSDDSSKLTVKGQIKGLKKGTIYLKKANDSTLVTVDSLIVNGDSNFKLESNIEEPEVFYLELDKNDNDESQISFFAAKGVTEINTTLKNFVYDATINGSEQQDKLNDYRNMLTKFNNRYLDLIKENLEAMQNNDTIAVAKAQKESKNLEKRKYLYTANYAITIKDSEVAPYLALSELYNANIKLLDTINNSLTPKIKASLYGKKLQNFINDIKAEEKQ